MPMLEEEDLPLLESPDIIPVPVEPDQYDPKAPLPKVVPETPDSAPDTGHGDVLRDYFANQKLMRDRLDNAERTSTDNRFLARIGAAANTIGRGMAGVPVDNSAFDQMAKDANAPVERVERQAKVDQSGDRMLLNYFMNRDKAAALAKYRGENIGIKKTNADNSKKRTEIYGDAVEEKKRHNKVNESIGQQGVGLRKEGLALREGSQAAQAAGKVADDKVIKQSNMQLAQLDKGLKRLADIISGKTPFTSTIKAELEKDAANILSGGSSSSLGQLQRIEGHFSGEGWQNKIDWFRNYKGDIHAPIYAKQLQDLFKSLHGDLQQIKGDAATRVKGTYGTAYSQNKLATQALDDAVKNSQAPGAGKKVLRKQYSASRNQTKVTYTDGTEEIVNGRQE